jgi:hypothetical protein
MVWARNCALTGIWLIFAALGLFAGNFGGYAQDIPGGPEASPDIYHVVAEDELMRVVHIIWPPGARDNWHGHPATSVYYETDCHVRIFFPDGSQQDLQRKAGTGRARSRPVISHSVQNIGDKECRMVHTEIKLEN